MVIMHNNTLQTVGFFIFLQIGLKSPTRDPHELWIRKNTDYFAVVWHDKVFLKHLLHYIS